MELDPEEGMSAEKLRRLAEALRDERAATKKARLDRTAQRLRSLAPTADLSRTDIDILVSSVFSGFPNFPDIFLLCRASAAPFTNFRKMSPIQ